MILILPTGRRGYKVLQEADDCGARECVDVVHRDTIKRNTETDDYKVARLTPECCSLPFRYCSTP